MVGASSGIGQALVCDLLHESITIGAHFHTKKSELESIIHQKDVDQSRFHLFSGDLRHQKSCHNLIDRFYSWAGGIDALVQLTGNVADRGDWKTLAERAWINDLQVNLSGPFFLAQRAMKYMCKNSGGRIILTSTASASHGGGPDSLGYGVAKAGIECLVKGLARFGANDGVLVNAIAPGFIDTKFHVEKMKKSTVELKQRMQQVPLKRAGSASEVSSAIKYLLSQESGYITGECISISGGDWL